VTLADSLVEDFDIADVLSTLADHSVTLFDASAAGIILGPNADHLDIAISTSEQSRRVDLTEIRNGSGPCLDAVRTGRVITAATGTEIGRRWPMVADAFAEAGYRSTHAIPLRLRGETIGSLNLFRTDEGILSAEDSAAAQALADVATIGILHQRVISDGTIVQEQLQRALDSRVVVEQAKGVLTQQLGIGLDEAFDLLRHHARSTQTNLSAVATGVLDGSVAMHDTATPSGTN
jgi:GAF domain-containing protein